MIYPGQRPLGYLALADLLRDQITDGQLRPGARLPSERDLAQTYGVAAKTARAALMQLRQEGLAWAVVGYGVVVRETVEPVRVAIGPDDEMTARPPTPSEREQHEMPEGVPLLVVIHPDGTQSLYPAHLYRLTARPD
ncbi:GntR family transcriptional regulator [Micromonospora craterilacus]|uniref:GntR family transcriptional regulator n=1 Tax=Micromonospora craterilacus TaxID=1655439 RepID=A0A2W2EI47_9ACTN|nr:winged helix-turn-helix domain-containing protein [Micromonospora craterilacus]PZG16475.1 GntR family transcriptional regulator [Micromonospora craterilacus]